jgi:flagellar assembly protein FliH
LSETAVSYDFEQLEPSAPPPRDEHERLLAAAGSEAQQIREQARAEGYAQGVEEGSERIAASLAALGEGLQALDALRVEVAQAVERDAVELALSLAGKILAGALQARPELVVEAVQGALRRASDRRQITVLLNPGDLEIVTGAIGELKAQAGGIELHDLVGDQRIQPGGVMVRTAEGEIDAGVATQLERAREVVMSELQSGE